MSQKRSARGHVHRTAEEKAALVAEWEAGGLPVHAFEQQRGLARNSLWRWKRDAGRARRDAPGRSSITFAPVHIAKAQSSATMNAERVIAEVVLGREVRVRVLEDADTRQVSLLVRALMGGSAC
jgi:transposase-like protein